MTEYLVYNPHSCMWLTPEAEWTARLTEARTFPSWRAADIVRGVIAEEMQVPRAALYVSTKRGLIVSHPTQEPT